MADQYFIKHREKVKGPFTVKDLQAMRASSNLHPKFLISQSQSGPWTRLGDVYESIVQNRKTAQPTKRVVQEERPPQPAESSSSHEQPARQKKSGLSVVVLSISAIVFIGLLAWRFGPQFLQQTAEKFSGSTKTANSDGVLALEDLIAMVEPAVVRLDVETGRSKGVGSGFVVDSDGMLVTNYHVIKDATRATATFVNGKTAEVIETLFLDQERDIAVLRIKTDGNLQSLPIAQSAPQKGETVVAFGAPKGLSFSATDGIVSAVRLGQELTQLKIDVEGTWIQTSAPISSGNSGGPLVNRKGQVVGANTMTRAGAQNINFAISSMDILAAIKKSRSTTATTLQASTFSTGTSGTATSNTTGGSGEAGEAFYRSLREGRDQKLETIDEIERSIEAKKRLLKRAMLLVNKQSEATIRRELEELVSQRDSLIQQPLPIPALDLLALTTGQCGHLRDKTVKVLQVTDKDSGSFLAIPLDRHLGRGSVIFMSGISLASVVDEQVVSFPDGFVFEVVGTRTYVSVTGADRTVFHVNLIRDSNDLRASLEIRSRRLIVIEPVFTDAEQKEMIAAKRDAEAATRREMREKTANSKLQLAKKFIKLGKRASASKWLKEVVRDYSETSAGKEAKRLLIQFQ